jgi:hypothetical protein
MKIRRPSQQDLETCRRAIDTFEDASGSFNFMGEFEPDHGHPFALWIMLPITREQADKLWISQGIETEGDQAAYKDMLASESHDLYLKYFKVKTGFLSYIWVGNVKLLFGSNVLSFKNDGQQIDIGSISGDSQESMWEHFRRVLTGKDRLFAGTIEGIAGSGLMGEQQ